MNINVLDFSNITSKVNIAVSDPAALSVGPNGNTNPVLRVVTNVASQATGLSITGNAAGSGVALNVLSSGSNENLLISPKGTGYTQLTSGMLGIGVPPTYGLHLAPTSGLTAGQTAFIQDATASTGITKIIIKAGAAQSSNALTQWQDNAGNQVAYIDTSGIYAFNAGGALRIYDAGGGGYSLISTNRTLLIIQTTVDSLIWDGNLYPNTDNIRTIGTSSKKWSAAYSTRLLLGSA